MLKVAITGIGFMGWIHYLAYKRVPNVQIVAFCEKYCPERLAGDWTKIKGNFGPQGEMIDMSPYKTYTEFEEMLQNPDIDMVDICLPPNQHAQAAIAALKAGKHVFCEKPIALKPEDGAAMVVAAQESGKQLNIGHVLPFFTAYKYIYDAQQSGKWGKLLGGNFERVISDPVWLKKYWDMDVVGGPLLDLHVHDAHFIRVLFGLPKNVQGIGRCRNGIPAYFQTQFRYDDPDLVVSATSGTIDQQARPFMCAYEVHFEKATVLFDSYAGLPVTVLHADGTTEKPDFPADDDVAPFAAELTEATSAILEGRTSALLAGKLASDAVVLCYKETEAIVNKTIVDF